MTRLLHGPALMSTVAGHAFTAREKLSHSSRKHATNMALWASEAVGQTNRIATHANTRADTADARSRIRTADTAAAGPSKLYSQVDTRAHRSGVARLAHACSSWSKEWAR